MEFLVNLPADDSPIVDADEEIFLLYTALMQAKTELVGPDGYRGLGHVDSRKGTLTIQFELRPPDSPLTHLPSSTLNSQSKSTKSAKRSKKKVSDDNLAKVIEIEITQDPTALRSRNGDTGSVVWRASIALAKAILQQHFFPVSPFFNRDMLSRCSCLELGSGTGLLGLALAPLVREYTITDIEPLLPLIRKNISLNVPNWRENPTDNSKSNITIEELDWVTLSSLPPGPIRSRYFPMPRFSAHPSFERDSTERGAWDMVLAVDCIYNPSLLPAFVETVDAVSTPGRTWVLVVAELRQEDVLREFLDLWLKQADGRWRITRVNGLLDVHFVVWAAQKR